MTNFFFERMKNNVRFTFSVGDSTRAWFTIGIEPEK